MLRRAASRGLPTVFFVAVCGLSAFLWQYQTQSQVLIGEVEAMEYVVSSPQAGLISQIVPSKGVALGVYVSVEKDQLLIQLDDRETRAKLASIKNEFVSISEDIRSELGRLDSVESLAVHDVALQLDEESEEEQDSEASPSSGNASVWNTAQRVVDQGLTEVEVSLKELNLRELDFQISQTKAELAASGQDVSVIAGVLTQRRALADEVFELRNSLVDESADAFRKIDDDSLSDTSRLLFRSLKKRIGAVETTLDGIKATVERLDVVSPVQGQIESAMIQQSEVVTAGQPLLSIVPRQGTTIVVYAREQSLIRPFTGMPVILRSRLNPQQQVAAAVTAVGPMIDEIPERHRANPKIIEWGRPMRIDIPADWVIEPGSLIDVIVDQS